MATCHWSCNPEPRERDTWMKPKQPGTPSNRDVEPWAQGEPIVVSKHGKVRLTQIRRHLLERLRGQPDRPLGAYALTRDLENSLGRNVTATSVYRALDFLMRHDLVMRIESRNAYLPCPKPGRPFTGAFLVCERCGGVTCVKDASLSGFLAEKVARLGFSVRHRIVELHGTCARCSAAR